MSWSASATGTPSEVQAELDRQLAWTLAEGTAGLTDAGEKETVRLTAVLIHQCLETFAPDTQVIVTASGHMGFQNWDTKAGAYQNMSLSIKPC